MENVLKSILQFNTKGGVMSLFMTGVVGTEDIMAW